jgi:RNA methyltransferase, TrmH family
MTHLTESQAKHIRELLRSAKERREDGAFVTEGPHLLEAALEKAPGRVRYAAFTSDANARQLSLSARCGKLGITTYSIPAKLASRISDTEEPQGIFAVISIPNGEKIRGDFAIALDRVQDPGNVGTIIRTAGWFGVRSLILGEGTADPYAPKTVRATQGAIFDVSIEREANLLPRLISLRAESCRIIATALDSSAKSLYDFKFQKKTILVFGSEAHGVSPEILEIADEKIAITRFGSGESLNVAASAAVVLYELRRKSGG